MSHLLDQFRFFKKKTGEYADGHGEIRDENRDWENGYRSRWQFDKIVRSTHGVNCTGSCSWKIYVKNGLVTWETQQTDYPRTRPDLPNHEPRGCPRGASYSWYMYSANRVKYPKVRKPLLKLWREAKAVQKDPVDAWASIVTDPTKTEQYKSKRGMGGFVRSSWNEVVEIIAAANIYTAKTFGPDRIIGFSPIPAMSMISYAAGSRYLSLIGGVCLSFYDWYCDLPPASPMTWGEQTDVPEAADWYNSDYIIAWGSNVPQTRATDAHFFTEVRLKAQKLSPSPLTMPRLPSLANIYNSNTPTIKALLARLPVQVRDYGIIPDDLDQTKAAVQRAIDECDVIISSAGVSVGDYDYLTEVIGQLGRVHHYKVNMKPGKPFVFGEFHRADKPVLYFGLPGNPLSTIVGMLQFVRPALWQLSGCASHDLPYAPAMPAVCQTDITKKGTRQEFLRAVFVFDGGRLSVKPLGAQDSHRVKQMSHANCLLVLPCDCTGVKAGDTVMIEPFEWCFG